MTTHKDVKKAIKKIQNFTRKELIESLNKQKKFNLNKRQSTPILKQKYIEEIRTRYIKSLNKPKKSIKLPLITIEELNQIINEIENDEPVSKDNFIKNSLIVAKKFQKDNHLSQKTTVTVFIQVTYKEDDKINTKSLRAQKTKLSKMKNFLNTIWYQIELLTQKYEHIAELIKIDIRFMTQRHKTNFRKVANFNNINIFNPNCLAYLLSTVSNDRKTKLMKLYPFLLTDEPIPKKYQTEVIKQEVTGFSDESPITNSNIFITDSMIEKIAKATRTKIVTYSKLGRELNLPWRDFGFAKDKPLPVVINDEHSWGVFDGKITEIKYVSDQELKIRNLNTVKIIENSTEIIGRIDHHTLFKSYHPINFINNYPDVNFDFCFSESQAYSLILKHQYGLKPPSRDLTDIIKAAEIFPSGAKYQEVLPTHFKYDHNASFRSPQTSPYYRGFPSHDLTPATYPDNPAFIATILDFSNSPIKQIWEQFIGISKDNFYVLPYPLYEFAVDHNVISTPEYYLNCSTNEFIHIDFSEYSKTVGNSLIGRSIAGGMKSEKKHIVTTRDPDERDHLIYEADSNNIPYTEVINQITDELNEYRLTFFIKTDLNQLFHFHSYVLAYSATQIMEKWLEVTNADHTIIAFRSDGFISTIPEISALGTSPGMWKREQIQPYYYQLEISENPTRFHDFTNYRLDTIKQNLFVSSRNDHNIDMEGDAGCGKSYNILKNPNYRSLLTTPTIELKAAHIRTVINDNLTFPIKNIQTVQKVFQLHLSDDEQFLHQFRKLTKIFDKPKIIYVDEKTKLNQSQWEIIFRRAKLINCDVIPMGDQKQNKNSIKGEPLSDDFFKNKGYQTKTFSSNGRNESIATNYSRFLPEYQQWLDTITDEMSQLSNCDQVNYLYNQVISHLPKYDLSDVDIIKRESIDTNSQSRIIVGTHKKKAALYEYFLPMMTEVLCKHPTKRTIVVLPTTDPRIYYKRDSLTDPKVPSGSFEPVTITTTDQIQGSTSRVYIDLESIMFRCRMSNDIGPLYTAITRGTTFSENILI